MIILDIETSGLSPRKNSLLSIGAIDYITGEEFYGECYMQPYREANEIALQINGFTQENIQRGSLFAGTTKLSDIDLYLDFIKWAAGRSKILGGHNVGHFDILFVEEIHGRIAPDHVGKFPFSYRTVDLHSVAYSRLGESLSHEQICERLGLPKEPAPHNALSGARSERDAFKILLDPLSVIKVNDPYLQTK